MLTRRSILRALFAALGLLPIARAARSNMLWQPEKPEPQAFLKRALDLAAHAASSGEGTPYGAVIVKSGEIVGEGWNRSYVKTDPTSHGEVEAVQDAARRLGTRDLSGCIIYTNGGRPCPMCEMACYWANIDEIVYGSDANNPINHGAPRYGGC